MEPSTGCPLGMFGNKRQSTGLRKQASALINPLFSPIFMMPNQNANTPVRPSEISKAVFEESNVEFMIAVNISVSPRKITFKRAMIKAMTKNPIQM